MDTEEQFYVSWRGKVTGPFTLKEIEARLMQRSINSLSRIQIGGDWVLLRDALAQLRQVQPKAEPEPEPVIELKSETVEELEQPLTLGGQVEPVWMSDKVSSGQQSSSRAPARAPEPKVNCRECGTQILASTARARSGLCAPCSRGEVNSQSSSDMDAGDWFWGILGLGLFILIMWMWISAGTPNLAPDKWFLVPGKRGVQPVPVYEFDTK